MNTVISKSKCYILSVLLAAIMAANYEIFIFPNSFAPSGINGIATMIQHLFDFSVGYLSLLINIPLVIWAFIKIDRSFALRSLTFVFSFSAALLIFQNIVDMSAIVYHTSDGKSQILAPVAAGTINGIIYGFVLKLNSSTGGTDIIAAFVHDKRKDLDLVWVIFGLNSFVAIISYFVYDYNFEPVILCIIYSFLMSRISDMIIKGGKSAVKFEVITLHPDELAAKLIQDLRHGVTVLPARGMYTHEEKALLICIVNRRQVPQFTSIIKSYSDTFAYLSSVTEIVGNFRNNH